MTKSQWYILLGQSRVRPLDRLERRALEEARIDEMKRRLDYIRDKPFRELRQAFCEMFTPILNLIARMIGWPV